MRHILIELARSKQRAKRGGKAKNVTLEDNLVASSERPDEIVWLDDALKQLDLLDERKLDERKSQVV